MSGHRLEAWLAHCTFGKGHVRCGVSGGADSLALLALAAAAGRTVTAVHVDHGLRPDGAAEAALVERYASEVGATFESAQVDIVDGPNLEARMRAARYEVLGDGAATGHTADDQAETLLINLMRGAGLVGLGAMQPGPRRPILALRRTDTEAVCAARGWEPFTDPSNADPRFVRNRVRSELVPLLADISGRDVVPLLTRSAAHARDAASVLVAQSDELDPTDARALAAAPDCLATLAIQRWLRAETGDEHPIDYAAAQRVLAVARGDAVAAEVTGGHRVARSAQRLSIDKLEDQ